MKNGDTIRVEREVLNKPAQGAKMKGKQMTLTGKGKLLPGQAKEKPNYIVRLTNERGFGEWACSAVFAFLVSVFLRVWETSCRCLCLGIQAA